MIISTLSTPNFYQFQTRLLTCYSTQLLSRFLSGAELYQSHWVPSRPYSG